jgi:DNA-binding GntR family transcriptional regulator
MEQGFALTRDLRFPNDFCIHGLMNTEAPLVIDTAPLAGLSASEIAFRTIWQLISRGTFESGAIFTEERLAALLSISRTPLREAARRLEDLGLLEREAARGLRVTPLSMREMLDLSATREALEGTLAASACRRIAAGEVSLERLEVIHERLERVLRVHDVELALTIGIEFHEEIRRLSGNRSASRFHEQILLAFERYRHLASQSPARPDLVHAEHGDIIAALRAGDAAAAEASMRRHIAQARDVYSHVLSARFGEN